MTQNVYLRALGSGESGFKIGAKWDKWETCAADTLATCRRLIGSAAGVGETVKTWQAAGRARGEQLQATGGQKATWRLLALLVYGLSSSRRAPDDAIHPYGYSKERFVWSLISAVGIFCLGSGATIVHEVQNLWTSQPPGNIKYAALVIAGSFIIEGVSLIVAIQAVKKGAAAEGMKVRDYIWRGHDPTSVAVMTEDGAAVAGLVIARASLVAVNITGNGIYDSIGSIIVGNLLGMVCDVFCLFNLFH
ncbi:metal tolerance protein C4-like [Humulus lupulus]|uniref:metal tolerance protein C4-like n=1 Tax=Humulus lupulus TaxID=3486 RepID=UPI002B41802D|nr:metal tolerance protein C4-like [Humulus lupulus]